MVVMGRSGLHPIAFAAAAVLTACVAAPDADAPKGLGTSLQRVLAIDLSRPALSERSRGLADTGTSLGQLALRTPDADSWGTVAGAPAQRFGGLQRSSARLVEFALRPRGQGTERLFASAAPQQVTSQLTESLAGLPWVLGADRRPLAEIDDLRHRTDPDDDHPEADLIERLRRRLRL